MSAQEVIEQIKALPPQERALVVDFVHHLEDVSGNEPMIISDAELKAAAEKVFDRHDDLFRKLAK